jgi:hypothetical protein
MAAMRRSSRSCDLRLFGLVKNSVCRFDAKSSVASGLCCLVGGEIEARSGLLDKRRSQEEGMQG